MALKAHLENSSLSSSQGEARQQERRALFLETSGTLPGGLEANVIIHNISKSGLLLETELALSLDERLVLDLPEVGAVRAVIVWQSGFLFGCAFEKEIDQSAFAGSSARTPRRQTEPLAPRTRVDLGAGGECSGCK